MCISCISVPIIALRQCTGSSVCLLDMLPSAEGSHFLGKICAVAPAVSLPDVVKQTFNGVAALQSAKTFDELYCSPADVSRAEAALEQAEEVELRLGLAVCCSSPCKVDFDERRFSLSLEIILICVIRPEGSSLLLLDTIAVGGKMFLLICPKGALPHAGDPAEDVAQGKVFWIRAKGVLHNSGDETTL